jgi:hypothetical protein
MAAREAKLIAGMLPMSESNDWADAKSEWEFSHTTRDDRDCYENRAITQWELNFLNSIQNKQLGKLTANQIVCLTKLNKKMILYITTKK